MALSSTNSNDTSWGGTRLGAHLSSEIYDSGVRFGAETSAVTYPPSGSGPPYTFIKNGRGAAGMVAAGVGTGVAISSRLWGTCGSVTLSTSGFANATAARQREMDDMKSVYAANFPRYAVGGSTPVDPLLLTNFPNGWVAVYGSSGTSYPANATLLSYWQAHQMAYIEPINEPNCNSAGAGIDRWTPEQIASLQISWYSYAKANGVTTPILMPSICNSYSPSGIHPLEWVRRVAAAGCTVGVGFDWANYHMYSNDPAGYDNWQHVWTPDASGHSMQNYLGNPWFIVSEFGFPTSSASGTTAQKEAAQASACAAWFNAFKAQVRCAGAMWYALSEDVLGTGSGYGLRRLDLTHKPAWDTFSASAGLAITGVAQEGSVLTAVG